MHINEYEQICKKYLVAQVSSNTNEKRWRPDASLSRHEKAIKTFARNSTYRANLWTREAIPIWNVESIDVEFANRLPMAWKQISPAQILANTCGAIVCLPKLRNMQLCPDFRECYCCTLSQNHRNAAFFRNVCLVWFFGCGPTTTRRQYKRLLGWSTGKVYRFFFAMTVPASRSRCWLPSGSPGWYRGMRDASVIWKPQVS